MLDDLKYFCNNFNIVDNAMQMRTLIRWNGKDLREKENLSEHTHLVVACAIKIYDELIRTKPSFRNEVDFEKMIKLCMVHDSLELLRGDILSITKDAIEGLREKTDEEEHLFMSKICGDYDNTTFETVILADLMACYKFIEYELRFPSNDFAINVYKDVKEKFEHRYEKFLLRHNFDVSKVEFTYDTRLVKGYEEDAGTDIILQEDVMFMPMSTVTFSLKIKITPKKGEMGILCSRTSAAKKGLIVAMCPIDPNYDGDVMAIVHNVSNNIIKYRKGEAFCQIVTIPFKGIVTDEKVSIKKKGKRRNGNFGSTDK